MGDLMDSTLFDKLLESVQEMAAVESGEKQPARVSWFTNGVHVAETYENTMKPCYICGKGTMTVDSRETTFNYRGHTKVITGIEGEHCDTCGESVLEPGEGEKYATIIREFREHVDAEYGKELS